MAPSTSFVKSSNINFSSPRQASFSPGPPSPITSVDDDDHDDIDPTHAAGPARKRPRTSSAKDTSAPGSNPAPTLSEQRKEARAHRNRIAAQNSRDRRKAQFAYLERRVVELEEENRRLRVGMGVGSPTVVPAQTLPVFASSSVPLPVTLSHPSDEQLRAERERAKDRENEELRERIKTLERGWETVVRALTAQGLTAGLLGGVQTPPPSTTPTAQPSPSSQTSVSSKPTYNAFPSPAPSHSSLDPELTSSSTTFAPTASLPDFSTSLSHNRIPSPSPAQPAVQPPTHSEPTRHLARVATTGGPSLVRSVSLQRVDFSSAEVQVQSATQVLPSRVPPDSVTDKAMEALYREILASPRASHAAMPVVKGVPASAGAASAAAQVSYSGMEKEEKKEGGDEERKKKEGGEEGHGGVDDDDEKQQREGEERKANKNVSENESAAVMEWANEIEMQRILDSMIMGISSADDFSATMNDGSNNSMDLGALDLAQAGLGIGMGMGMDVAMGLDMDLGMGFSEPGVDYLSTLRTGAGWDGLNLNLGGAGVF
ncbi:hypothetical protein CPB84DRAFT_1748498 [Gymnopilus junonius]|uniref:BZIP domain-containing protein n=1 Tax=Gymnopilus junonius TaxID=109634 RepID=A0A9P5NMS4_GYMJU|nr:hypothetical protein CPB84DRAFT_1748498 [Gymnopilus junonius]